MSPDPGPLSLAAQRKSHDAITRTRTALCAMHDTGAPITFQGIAQHAGVSRQWLYKNAELRAEIDKLRGHQTGPRRVPTAQRASDASQRQRNATLTAENQRLRTENSELKDELATLLGERRLANVKRGASR